MRSLFGGIVVLLSCTTISGCKLIFEVEGKGFLVSDQALELLWDGAEVQANDEFADSYRPVPFPGHSFAGWGAICRNSNTDCKIQVPASIAALGLDATLEPSFTVGYSGPLRLPVSPGGRVSNEGRFLQVGYENFRLEGAAADDPHLLLLLADLRMEHIIPGRKTEFGFEFIIPEGSPPLNELWMMASAVDSEGTLATVATDLGSLSEASASAITAYRDSIYADVLVDCAARHSPFDLCNVGTLPPIGRNTSEPTVNDILERTAVSHSWMGDRFAELLERMPPEVLRMMRSVTAIVIADDIRPSNYSFATGAIYLDPDFLWVTRAEKASVSTAPDYRESFGEELSFIPLEIYLEGTGAAWDYYPPGVPASRTVSDAEAPFAALLFHELAHASDVVPPTRIDTLDLSNTLLEEFYLNREYGASDALYSASPLQSRTLINLAYVLFLGAEPPPLFGTLSANEVGLAFDSDPAVMTYAYVNSYEDVATLTEVALMEHFYGYDFVNAFADMPDNLEEAACNDFIVRWGQRSRLAKPDIALRAELALQQVLQMEDTSQYLSNTTPTSDLVIGTGFCDSLEQSYVGPDSTHGQHRSRFGTARSIFHRHLPPLPLRPPEIDDSPDS